MGTVAQMSKEELQEIVEAIVEQKLVELFGDPEMDQPIKEAFKERLLRQKQLVAVGERGEFLEEVIKRLGLE
jgi:uncharacterized protein YaaN involved in tellurite resistance